MVEVNSTPISPASPANFGYGDCDDMAFTGDTIQATAVGTGCSVNSPNDCVVTDPTGDQLIRPIRLHSEFEFSACNNGTGSSPNQIGH